MISRTTIAASKMRMISFSQLLGLLYIPRLILCAVERGDFGAAATQRGSPAARPMWSKDDDPLRLHPCACGVAGQGCAAGILRSRGFVRYADTTRYTDPPSARATGYSFTGQSRQH